MKREQREEREAWFKDGKKEFKATRNAVWREVKDEYREDWKAYFADKAAREAEAEQHSETAIGRALWFAKVGDWEAAREAFGDRDAVRKVVAAELVERRQELRQEQMSETRARQELAIGDLRAEREDGYKALLERQQAERAEMRAAHAQGEKAADLLAQVHAARSANENISPDVKAPHPANVNAPDTSIEERVAAAIGQAIAETRQPGAPLDAKAIEKLAEQIIALDAPNLSPDAKTAETRSAERFLDRAVTGAADLAAGGIGGAASYLADQLAEFFAPTPPELREALAKAAAKQQAEKVPDNPYLKHAPAAAARSEDERHVKDREEEYWLERRRERDR